ncbi:FUSC family protein [Nocardia tengchongensis]|uniref:FUSC family protein n=1 Tax=Nocardia tengchongensis TaxID=2055889 RepID=UPI00360F91B9
MHPHRPTAHPWRGLIRELLSIAPRGDDHHYALRVALGLAIPGAMLVLARRTDMLVFAAFGSFVGMYGRGYSRGPRVRQQLVAATVLGTGVVIGGALARTHARPITLVLVETAFAALASLVADRAGLRPAGPFFGLFALGAVAAILPGTGTPLAGLSLYTATAALCVLLGTLHTDSGGPSRQTAPPASQAAVACPAQPTETPREAQQEAAARTAQQTVAANTAQQSATAGRAQQRAAARTTQQTVAAHTAQQPATARGARQAAIAATGQRVFAREELWHAGRYALAVAIAGAGGVALGVAHANWAMAAAAVPLAAGDSRGRVLRGVERVAGTFVGLGASALLLLPHPPPWLLGVSVLVLLFPTELFMARNYALALGFFTPLIMVMTELAAPADPVRLLLDRGTDTVLGVTVGVAVAVLTRPRTPEAVSEFRVRTAPPAR